MLPDSGRTLEAEPIIDHPVWSRLANEHGIYQVGDRLRKYTYEFYVDFYGLTEEEVEFIGLISPEELRRFAKEKDAMIQPIERRVAYRSPSSIRVKPNHCILGYTDRGRRRFVGEIWSTGTSDGRNVIARTKHQERTFWVWWINETDEVELTVTGSVSWNGETATTPANSGGTLSSSDATRIDQTLARCIDANTDIGECRSVSTLNLEGDFGGVGRNGAPYECPVNVFGLF